jgi:hypothetical protein
VRLDLCLHVTLPMYCANAYPPEQLGLRALHAPLQYSHAQFAQFELSSMRDTSVRFDRVAMAVVDADVVSIA